MQMDAVVVRREKKEKKEVGKKDADPFLSCWGRKGQKEMTWLQGKTRECEREHECHDMCQSFTLDKGNYYIIFKMSIHFIQKQIDWKIAN